MNDSAATTSTGFGPDLGPFDWTDPLRLEDQLTEDERMLRDAAQVFAQNTLQPKVTAAIQFVKKTGGEVIITDPPNLIRAVRHETGTRVVRG